MKRSTIILPVSGDIIIPIKEITEKRVNRTSADQKGNNGLDYELKSNGRKPVAIDCLPERLLTATEMTLKRARGGLRVTIEEEIYLIMIAKCAETALNELRRGRNQQGLYGEINFDEECERWTSIARKSVATVESEYFKLSIFGRQRRKKKVLGMINY